MKMKNIMVVIACAVTSSVAFAAKMVVYNQIGDAVNVKVTYEPFGTKGEVLLKEMIVPFDDKRGSVFNTKGLTRFKGISWWKESSDGKPRNKFYASIPSLKDMLGGKITLYPSGEYRINFDQSGVSSSKELVMNYAQEQSVDTLIDEFVKIDK